MAKERAEEAMDGDGQAGTGSTEQRPLRQVVSRWIRSNFGRQSQDSSLKEMLEEVLEDNPQAAHTLAPEERVMLRNMLEFGELSVHDIMVPRTDIKAIEMGISLGDLKNHVMEHGHTRLPVYEETLDQVKGFIHVKDLIPMFCGDKPFAIREVLRQILFVPPSMLIVDLLLKMRVSGVHMAIVVDEYGGTDGLVTLEDLFEEIVGEIQDEHDEDETEPEMAFISDRVIEADARIRIDKLEEETGLRIVSDEEEKEFDTLGGLIFFQLGRVPTRGEVIEHPTGVKFEILDADPRRINRVRIVRTGAIRPPAVQE